jgi:hypothetical protein
MAESAAKKSQSGQQPEGYFQLTADPLASYVLVLPLLLVYQLGLFLTHGATMNGADVISITLLSHYGWNGLLAYDGVLLLVGFVIGGVLLKRGKFDFKLAIPVAIESTVYAIFLGLMITYVLQHALPGAWLPNAAGDDLEGVGALARVCLAIGAGVNEEFVFRLGFFGGLCWLGQKFMEKKAAVLAAVALSSVLFSLAHYLGPEQFELYSFFFRFLAGAFFCGLYWLRGFAVSVYTHAIYDVIVMVVLA